MVILFGLYWLILRKEKLFTFNRCYLIISVLFSLTLTFISIPIDLGSKKVVNEIVTVLNHKPELNSLEHWAGTANQEEAISGITDSNFISQPAANKSNPIDSKKILLIIYLSGLMLMLVRFYRNILLVHQMFRRSEKIDHEGYKIALLDYPINPFSFFRIIFLNKQDYIENRITVNVLRHELEHVRQSHSYDILFFEILQIVFWFNPILILYNWAARINHEYLADEAVIKSSSDIETYASELINFISRRANVRFTSGFSPSMIRKRLLMLNTNTSKWGKNIRMGITTFFSGWLMIILCIRPAYPDTQDRKNVKQIAENDDIVIEEVYFRNPDFKPLQALVVIDGKKLYINDTFNVEPQYIKTINILKDRKAIRKYGRTAKNGVIVISTYKNDKKSVPDSLYFKPIYVVNNKVPEGSITIPFSNLYSLSMWTYPIFPNQDLRKRWRTTYIMTRDFYRIRGKVIQNDGEPLPGVLVTATDYPSKVTTAKDGRFLLEDLRSDAVVELYAEGYEPLFFKVKEKVFTSDLTITLDKKNERNQNLIWVNNNIKDFSGNWKYNKELTKTPFPIINYVSSIHQFDSDSIVMNISTTLENNRELNSNAKFVFNTVKTEVSNIFDATKSTITCSIAADGQSFSVTHQMKSKLGLFKDYKRTEIYSLSDDEKHLIIRTFDFPDISSITGEEIIKMVFDRM
jgi:hypothetical protein